MEATAVHRCHTDDKSRADGYVVIVKSRRKTLARVGCQGRKCTDGVQPDSCPLLLLAVLMFQESEKCGTLLGHGGSKSPQNPIRAGHGGHAAIVEYTPHRAEGDAGEHGSDCGATHEGVLPASSARWYPSRAFAPSPLEGCHGSGECPPWGVHILPTGEAYAHHDLAWVLVPGSAGSVYGRRHQARRPSASVYQLDV